MRLITRRGAVSGVLTAVLAAGAAIAAPAASEGATRVAAATEPLPKTLGFVASVSASVKRPVGKRLVIQPHATYVVRQVALAKVLKTLAARRKGTWHPRVTVTFRVRIASVPASGTSRTLAVHSRTLTGARLIASARRAGPVVRFRLGRIVLSRAQTARITRVAKQTGKLRASSTATFKVRFQARGHHVTLRGVPWSFSSVVDLKAARTRVSGGKAGTLDQKLRSTISLVRQLPLTCEVRNALVRRLRLIDGALLSGRRSAAAQLLAVGTATPGALGSGVLTNVQQTVLRDRLAAVLRQVGAGSPRGLRRNVHWPKLPSCNGRAGAAAGYQPFDPGDAKTFVVGMVKMIPTLGGLLGPLVDILWPSNDPLENVKLLISDAMTEKLRTEAANVLGDVRCDLPACSPANPGGGLAGVVSNFVYLEDIANRSGNPTDLAAMTSFYTNTALGFFTENRGTFEPLEGTVTLKDRFLLMPLAAQYENLYLAVLREGVLRGLDWGFSQQWVDGIESTLKTEIAYATNYVNTVRDQKLRTDLGCKYPADLSSTTSCATDPETVFAKTNADARSFEIGVGDWAATWSRYDPVAYPGGDPNFRLTRMIYSDRIGDAEDSFAKPGNVQYPLTSLQAWDHKIKDEPWSINSIKTDRSPLVGNITGDTRSTGSTDTSQCNAGDCIQSYTNTWIPSAATPITTAWGSDLMGFIMGIRMYFKDGTYKQLGQFGGTVCDPNDQHVGCGIHKYSFDDESVQAVRIMGSWRPYPVIYPHNYYGDSLVYGFRFTDSFFPSGQVHALGANCLGLPTGTWTAGTQVHVASQCSSPPRAEQTWTYDSITGQLSSSNGAVDTKFEPGNVGKVCLQARGGGTTPGTPVDIYNCTDQPRTDVRGLDAPPRPTPAQQWTVGSGGEIVNVASKLCLDANPTLSTLQTCNGAPTQAWTTPWTTRLPGGVRAPDTQACMTATGSRAGDLQDLSMQNCQWTTNADGLSQSLSWDQNFEYDTIDNSTVGAPDLTYHALTLYGGTRCVVNDASLTSLTEVAARIRACDGSDRQKWTLTSDGRMCSTVRGSFTPPTGNTIGFDWCIRRYNGLTAPGTAVKVAPWISGVTQPTGSQWVWPSG